MANIYIVTRATGSYDDYSISNQAVFAVREDAEKYIVERKALDIRRYEEEQVLAEFAKEYIQTNLYPPYPRRIEFPRWPAGMNSKDITAEMRVERQAIVDENKRNNTAYWVVQEAYNAKLLEAQQAFASEKGFIPLNHYILSAHAPDEDEEWDIEEMVLL